MAQRIANLDQLQAEIDRWFSASPYGLLLEGEDGRIWRLTPDQAAELKQLAMDNIQKFVTWQQRCQFLALGLLLALAYSFDWLAVTLTAVGAPWLMFPLGLVCFAPLMPFLWGAAYRRQQKRLRENFIGKLDRSLPLNPDMTRRYMPDKRFAGVARWLFFGVFAIAIVLDQFLPRTIEATIGAQGVAAFLLTGMLLVLAFYLLELAGRRRDRP